MTEISCEYALPHVVIEPNNQDSQTNCGGQPPRNVVQAQVVLEQCRDMSQRPERSYDEAGFQRAKAFLHRVGSVPGIAKLFTRGTDKAQH